LQSLILCLEDSFARIQSRLFEITDEAPPTLHFTSSSKGLHRGEQGATVGKLIAFNDPGEADTRKVLQNIHRDSDHPVSMWQYFAIQSLEEMLYLEFMEMIKRGIRIKRCGLCDRYFVLADKRKRDYCDRVYDGKRICKQIGAKQNLTNL
jgi:hypothetical protein